MSEYRRHYPNRFINRAFRGVNLHFNKLKIWQTS